MAYAFVNATMQFNFEYGIWSEREVKINIQKKTHTTKATMNVCGIYVQHRLYQHLEHFYFASFQRAYGIVLFYLSEAK